MGDEDVENKASHETPETPETGNDDAKAGGMTVAGVHVSDQQLPFVSMFFAAVILLVAITVGGKDLNNWAYGVSVASVAMFFSLLGFCLTFQEDFNAKVGWINSYFLFLWNFVGACVLTFDGPFKITSNGYFAAWGLAILSVMALGVTADSIKKTSTGLGPLYGLGACSIILIIAVSPEIRDDFYRNEGIYALVVACCTIVVVGVLIFMERKRGEAGGRNIAAFAVLAFFAFNWIVAASFVTFKGPFPITGNGYFAAWGGAVTSVFASMAALKE